MSKAEAIAKAKALAKPKADVTIVEFLPDADEIERSPLPRLARITLHVLVATLVSGLLWATFSEVDKVVVAHGRLVNPLPNIVVQPLETSIIQKIDVRIGQIVKKGERLATLDPTFAQADEAQLRSREASLETQSRSLAAELTGLPALGKIGVNSDSLLQSQLTNERQANFRAQLTKLQENSARARASMETNLHDQQVLGTRLKSLREIEGMQQKLVDQKFGARLSLLEAQGKRLEVERDMSMSKNREQELKRELASLEAEKSAFHKGWRQKIMEDMLAISRERDGIKEQLAKADKRRRLVTLESPSDAVVLEIAKLSQGSVVKEAEALFTLVPLGSELEAEVQIDSIDVGYIKAGDVAHVKIDAFPFQRHGDLISNVRTISEDAFRREASQGQGMDAFYLSRIKLGKGSLKRMNGKTRLLPGMTLSAEIVVGKRSVMSYLLWPLTKGLDESIREP